MSKIAASFKFDTYVRGNGSEFEVHRDFYEYGHPQAVFQFADPDYVGEEKTLCQYYAGAINSVHPRDCVYVSVTNSSRAVRYSDSTIFITIGC
jgi:hypothetical protein